MTPEQAAAFIHAQSVCAYAEIIAMQTHDIEIAKGNPGTRHTADEYREVPGKHGITYNQVMETFQYAR